MHKITFFTEATDKPLWLMQRNEIYTDAFSGVAAKYCAPTLAPAAGVLRSVLKSNMRIAFATFEPCDIFGEVGGSGAGFVTAFSSFNKFGQVPRVGDILFRDVLRFNLYPLVGRVGHQWWRGCLDGADVLELEGIGRGSRTAPTLIERFREAGAAYNFTMFEEQLLMTSGGILRRSTGETSYYTDSHAATRWRRRTRGKLVDASREVFAALELMSTALEASRYWQTIDVRISPGSVYRDLRHAILIGEAVHQAVEQASKAGNDGTEEAQTQPTLRFGPAWAAIIEAWNFAKEQGKKPLEELEKKFPPHFEGGDEYITTDFLSNYNELIEKIIERVALTANADWYNPRAYKNQISSAELKRLPDIIELAF
jgi:hypothetical protein